MKRAVVYDKWLSTLGGGEVVALNIALALQQAGYQVTFVSGKPVSLTTIKNKLNLDMSNISFVALWNEEYALKKLTLGAEIFVNASFMDYTTGLARKNYYYTSFPTTSGFALIQRVKNKFILPLVARFIQPTEIISDQQPTKYHHHQPVYQLSQQPLTLAFYHLHLGRKYRFRFRLFYPTWSKTNLNQLKFKCRSARIIKQEVRINHRRSTLSFDLQVQPVSETVTFSLQQQNNVPVYLSDLVYGVNKLNQVGNSILASKLAQRLRAGIFNAIPVTMKSFRVLTNSQFTSRWVQKYWHTDSRVIYPPVDLLFARYDLQSYHKKNYILSVGRFFTLGHGKKQEVMVAAFKKMCADGLSGWELHLAGGLGDELSSQAFAQKLQDEGKNYPIFFHFNCSKKEIDELYLHAKIYWHATGFNEDEQQNPIKMEHFGIAPIEAISAGCVPLLYNSGGLPEIIENLGGGEENLFESEKELIEKTKIIIDDNKYEWLTSKKKERLQQLYAVATFRERFMEVVG